MANLTATETQKQTELLFALHHRDRPTVVFLEANSPRKATELESFLTQNLPEYKFYTIDLTPHPTVSLLRVLTEQLPAEVVQSEPVTYSVNIKGLENSLLMNRDGRIEPSMLTAQLNLERELLFRNVPYNILIWADSHFFKTLQREAPDLWSWVTYKFRFEDTEALTDPSDRPDQHPPLPTKRLVQRGNIAERQVRIRELEDTLSRLNQNTADKIRLQRDKISIFSLLGQEYQEAFDFEKAEKAYQNAFAIAERIHADDFQLGELSFNLAGVYLDTQRFDDALTLYEQSMGYSKAQQFGAVFHQIGRAYAEQQQWSLALENYQQAIDWKTKTGNEFELGGTYHQIGSVYEEQNELETALQWYEEAVLNMSDFISPNLPIADESLDRVREKLRQQQDAL